MAWRVAASLEKLLAQINQMAPNRSRASDGSIGDASHQASATSDHNPHVKDDGTGVVTARDFTHDPGNKADMHVITEQLRRSKDPRIKYVIWNRLMFSSYATSSTKAWRWRSYSGSNPHTKHAHVSVQPRKSLYDDTSRWTIKPPPKKWRLRATKGSRRRTAVREKWVKAREWIQRFGSKGWKVIARKR